MTPDSRCSLLTGYLPGVIDSTVLRLLEPEDLSDFHGYRSDRELARYQGWSPMSEAEAYEFVSRMSGCDRLIPGDWVQLGIAETASGRLIGDVGIHVDESVTMAELGFTLSAEHQGLGHARRAVLLAINLIFRCTPVQRIIAVTDARNQSAIGLLQRTGFVRQREYQTWFKGERCSEIQFQIERSG